MTNKPSAENFEIRHGLFEGSRRGMEGENPAAVFDEGIQLSECAIRNRFVVKVENQC